MKSNPLIAVLCLAACAFHPVPEDADAGVGGGNLGGDGGAGGGFSAAGGGQGSVGGGSFGVGGGIDSGGGSNYGGGGAQTGGGSGNSGDGGNTIGGPGGALEIIVNQIDTIDGSVDVWFDTGVSIRVTVACGTHCIIDPAPTNHPFITAHLGNHYAYGTWDSNGLPRYVGWHFWPDLTGRASTTVTLTLTGHNILFRTTDQYPPGALGDGDGGVSVADALCTQQAGQRGLAGNYIAWLSTSTKSAAERVPTGVRGWVSASYGTGYVTDAGVEFDTPWEPVFDLPTDSFVFWPVAEEPISVATGTTDWGTLGANCRDWTSSDATDSYTIGVSNQGIPGFSGAGTATCDQPAPLYCLEIDHTAPLDNPIQTPLYVAFVTSGVYSSGGGLAAFDQACAQEATQANLTGTFKALVATGSATATSRVVAGPDDFWKYMLVDGMILTYYSDEAFDVTADGRMLVPVDANRPALSRLIPGDTRVWTGATSNSVMGNNSTCLDWLSASANVNATITHAEHRGWSNESADCGQKLHLFCAQLE